MKTETKHTRGAVKVAKIILNGKKLISTSYGEKNADGIADLIDRETAAPDMLEALEFAYVRALQTADQDSELVNKLFAAINKATGGGE